jgi:predicted ATPase
VITEGRVSSIVILTGSPGTGKTTVAARHTGTRDADAVAAELGPSLDRGDFVLDLSQVVHGNRRQTIS